MLSAYNRHTIHINVSKYVDIELNKECKELIVMYSDANLSIIVMPYICYLILLLAS